MSSSSNPISCRSPVQMRHHGSAFATAQEGVHGLLIVDDNDEGLAAVDEFEVGRRLISRRKMMGFCFRFHCG